jgi:hypothetical protein
MRNYPHPFLPFPSRRRLPAAEENTRGHLRAPRRRHVRACKLPRGCGRMQPRAQVHTSLFFFEERKFNSISLARLLSSVLYISLALVLYVPFFMSFRCLSTLIVAVKCRTRCAELITAFTARIYGRNLSPSSTRRPAAKIEPPQLQSPAAAADSAPLPP